MIKVYVFVDSKWRRIYNTENIALTSEIGGRIPSFSFSLPDKSFLFSIFNTASPYAGFLKKGNLVKIVKDDLTIAKGYIDEPSWQYPEQLVSVQCKGTMAKLQEDNFQGTDWSYESGTFSLAIPSNRYVDLSSYNATNVWNIKVNGKFFWSYEWNAVEQKIIITDNSSGTISGKYMAAVSPHQFFQSLLSGYDTAFVPLIHGTGNYIFSALNLSSGAELDGIDEELNGTGEVVTRPIDLGKYTTGFGAVTFNINGLVSAYIRGGDKRNTVLSNPWQEITSGANLNSIFGRFVRFVQFKFVVNEGEGENSVTIYLAGNAPNIEKIKFEDENKFSVLQKLADCYQCYLFEDRFGTLRMEHKETTEDWEETLDYLKFTGMKVEGNFSPKRVNVSGLEQKFTWLTGDMAGTEYTIKHKGAVEFEDDDLTGEVTIDNKYAWSEDILTNVALCYQPPLTKIRINTNREWELGDLIKIQTNYLEKANFASLMPFVDELNSKFPFVDVEETEIPFVSNVLLESNAVYRVSAKIYRDEIVWDYELEEVYRLPFKFYNLYEYYSSSEFGYYDDIFVLTEPEVVYVWDGEDWTTPPFDYNPETGEINIPNIVIPEITTPDTPIIPGEDVPENPIVVFHPNPTPQPNYQPYTPDGITQYRWFWDVWNCDYPLDNTVEKKWWEKDIGWYRWGRVDPIFSTGWLQLVSVNNYGEYSNTLIYGKKVNEETEITENWVGTAGPIDPSHWEYWRNYLSLVRGQGKEVEFKLGPNGDAISLWMTAGDVLRDKNGDTPTGDIEMPGGMRLYAITQPYNPYTCNQGDLENLQKVHIADFSVKYKTTVKTTVVAKEDTKQYENIDLLIKKDIPFYGLYLKPLWDLEYYVSSTTSKGLYLYHVLNTELTNYIVAQGSINKWKSGYGYAPELSITSGVWYPKWPDLPEYFFKLWRGFTFEIKFRSNPNVLDYENKGIELQMWNFKDGRYCRNFRVHFETFNLDEQGKKVDSLSFYIGNSDTVRATLSNNSWVTLRLVLLGVDRFKEIYDGDGISNWEDGELVGFTEEANLEYFKDVHDTKVRFKGLPTFSSYVAIYIDNQLIYTGTMDGIIRTGLSDYGLELMDYAKMALILDTMQEGSWYFDYIKMTDKAIDIQSGFDVEHLVV